MTETKHTKSTSKERSQASGCNFPGGDFKNMFKMMRNCCGSGEDSFDCCAMMDSAKMQQMWGETPKETQKQ